jgi:carboxylate-amine ligase
MSEIKKPYSLFEVTGVELEYMIVNRDTLSVMPVCDHLLQEVTGEITADYENGGVAWSNELVNHVVELKTNGPVVSLKGIDGLFFANIQQINNLLGRFNAMLLPTGAHPWMDPFTETCLWEHEYNQIYELYNRIFDCRGHGWSNLQSTHINLPFSGDEEFGRLHAAIRLVLPLLPALCASTPLLDSQLTGFSDSRLEKYRNNQKKIPSIAGKVIPEAVFTEAAYYEQIFDPIMRDIRPYDHDGVLDHHFLNSRGAIARFDRSAIEIRLIDIQESPKADLAIVEVVVVLLKWLVSEKGVSYSAQKKWHEDPLAAILVSVIRDGSKALITDAEYLNIWGIEHLSAHAGDVWAHLLEQLQPLLSAETYQTASRIIRAGTLSSRIVKALQGDLSHGKIKQVYQGVADALANNQLFNA